LLDSEEDLVGAGESGVIICFGWLRVDALLGLRLPDRSRSD
jgi:hypothetical protein